MRRPSRSMARQWRAPALSHRRAWGALAGAGSPTSGTGPAKSRFAVGTGYPTQGRARHFEIVAKHGGWRVGREWRKKRNAEPFAARAALENDGAGTEDSNLAPKIESPTFTRHFDFASHRERALVRAESRLPRNAERCDTRGGEAKLIWNFIDLYLVSSREPACKVKMASVT